MELKIIFNPRQIVGELNELTKIQLPRAAANALNLTVFKMREDMQQQARSRFKDPVPFTINSFLYKKATPDLTEATLFIREDAPKGNPPSRYLAPQIYSGSAYRTRFQQRLSNLRDPARTSTGPVLAPNRVMVPTQSPRGIRFTQRGNMSPGQYVEIYSYLKNTDSTETASRGRVSAGRAGRRYFYMNQTMVDERRNLRTSKPGIFMVQNKSLMRVMTESSLPTYNAKFPFFDIGRESANRYFPQFLRQQNLL